MVSSEFGINRRRVVTPAPIVFSKNEQYTSYLVWVIVLLIALLFIAVGVTVYSLNELSEIRRELGNGMQKEGDGKFMDEIARMQNQLGEMKDEMNLCRDASQRYEIPGPPGVPGKDGIPGNDGIAGKDGTPGKDGMPGSTGRDGTPGKDGIPGHPGLSGKVGPYGPKGAKGDSGNQGVKGLDGLPGLPGMVGQSVPGPQGPPGLKGESIVGPKGDRGPKGEKGDPGMPSSENASIQTPKNFPSMTTEVLVEEPTTPKKISIETTETSTAMAFTKEKTTPTKASFLKKIVKAVRG